MKYIENTDSELEFPEKNRKRKIRRSLSYWKAIRKRRISLFCGSENDTAPLGRFMKAATEHRRFEKWSRDYYDSLTDMRCKSASAVRMKAWAAGE